MITLTERNVCDLLPIGLDMLAHEGVRETSRAGDVIVMPCPVMSVYERPMERVLQCAKRDANPFFHLFESLWMLAGRDDAGSLNHYVKDFGERFAETGGEIHGAYGRRWRSAFGLDQLERTVYRLRKDAGDRQCVLQMWDCRDQPDDNPRSDSRVGCDDLTTASWKDRPCNTHVYLRVRSEYYPDAVDQGLPTDNPKFLDLTVLCRSNDIVWGAYGANAVHFSVLQEYLAGRIGVGVGRMYQLSNNYHGYVDMLDKIGEPREMMAQANPYCRTNNPVRPTPIGIEWDKWDEDLAVFMRWHDDLLWGGELTTDLFGREPMPANQWFETTAKRVAFVNYMRVRGRASEALDFAYSIEASDWREACVDWLKRRIKR